MLINFYLFLFWKKWNNEIKKSGVMKHWKNSKLAAEYMHSHFGCAEFKMRFTFDSSIGPLRWRC